MIYRDENGPTRGGNTFFDTHHHTAWWRMCIIRCHERWDIFGPFQDQHRLKDLLSVPVGKLSHTKVSMQQNANEYNTVNNLLVPVTANLNGSKS